MTVGVAPPAGTGVSGSPIQKLVFAGLSFSDGRRLCRALGVLQAPADGLISPANDVGHSDLAEDSFTPCLGICPEFLPSATGPWSPSRGARTDG